MATEFPDHISIERDSPFFYPQSKNVGVKFNGIVIFNAIELCVSQGWVRRAVHMQQRRGQMFYKKERGKIIAPLSYGVVELYDRKRKQ